MMDPKESMSSQLLSVCTTDKTTPSIDLSDSYPSIITEDSSDSKTPSQLQSGSNSIKYWDWNSQIISTEKQQMIDPMISNIEEVYFLKDRLEGQKLAQELTKTTGFILEYSILEDKSIGCKTLEEEMILNGYKTEFEVASNIIKKLEENEKMESKDPDMKHDYYVALSMYTSTSCYKIVNQSLWETTDNPTNMLKHVQFAANFIQGFRLLPSYWGKVYRGCILDKTDIEKYKPQHIVLFKGFTSSSKSADRAWFFLNNNFQVTDTKVQCFFQIDSLSGRCLENFSFFPNEEEVTFRPFTSFIVTKVEIKQDIYFISLKEAYPDVRSRKVLVWVDDKHAFESKLIMDNSERSGVTCVHLHSTKEAKEFFRRHPFLLQRDTDKLRIITDMVRVEEDGKQNIEAGLCLVHMLATDFKYRSPLMCFTGPKFLLLNREKFLHHQFKHVFSTARRQEAELFAKFVPIPSHASVKNPLSTSL